MKSVEHDRIRCASTTPIFRGTANSPTAVCCFPNIARLNERSLIAGWTTGPTKGSADNTIWVSRSHDDGRTWSAPIEPFATSYRGAAGQLCAPKFTPLPDGRILAAMMWFDRSQHPDVPAYYDSETESILPVKTLYSLSNDGGASWSATWATDDQPYDDPMTITSPVLVLPDGTWACPFEVQKTWNAPRAWRHAAAIKFSRDHGRSWHPCVEVANDPSGRIRYYDQRVAIAPDGRRCVAVFWTFNAETQQDRNVTLSESHDGGRSWSPPRDTGIAGQGPYPIFLPDGRLLVAYVDRFGSQTIRVRLSADGGKTFDAGEATVYARARPTIQSGSPSTPTTAAEHIDAQLLWTFGLPCGVAVSSDAIALTYYAGDASATNIYLARMAIG